MPEASKEKMNQQKPRKEKSTLQKGVQFSGIAFEMAATIILCVFIGKFLDGQFEMSKPIFTAVFSILGVTGAIYNLIRKVTKN
jgi:F0F1-type ATP synthase assembly protein I